MKLNFEWFRPTKRLSLEERNKLLEKEVIEAEEHAQLAEREAELRKRLTDAKARSAKAKRVERKSVNLKWILIVAVVAVICFSVIESC